jgi:hypothetical protein
MTHSQQIYSLHCLVCFSRRTQPTQISEINVMIPKLGISQVCPPNIVRIIEEVCFVENHAKSSEYRGIYIFAFPILIRAKEQEVLQFMHDRWDG